MTNSSLEIGRLLLKQGYITSSHLETCINIHKETGRLLCLILLEAEYIEQDTIMRLLSRQHSYNTVLISTETIDPTILSMIPYESAVMYMAFPVRLKNGILHVTMADPTDDKAIETIENISGKKIKVSVSAMEDIVLALRTYYKPSTEHDLKAIVALEEAIEDELFTWGEPDDLLTVKTLRDDYCKKSALKAIDWVSKNHPGMGIGARSVYDEENYFVFSYNSKKYYETGDDSEFLIGSGGVILDKQDGRFYDYGSGIPDGLQYHKDLRRMEQSIQQYFPDYDRDKRHTLIVKKTHNYKYVVKLFAKLHFHYLKPQVESNTLWCVKNSYSLELLESRLKKTPPITFANGGDGVSMEQLDDLLRINKIGNLLDFDIKISKDIQRTTDPAKATPEELATVW